MVTKQVIQELKRTLSAMETYEKGQTGRTAVVPVPGEKEYTFIERPDLWPTVDQNHSAALRASMDLTKAMAMWRQMPKKWNGPK